MKPFSGAAPCTKCGTGKPTVRYEEAGSFYTFREEGSQWWSWGYLPADRMERTCRACGFIWYETPLTQESHVAGSDS